MRECLFKLQIQSKVVWLFPLEPWNLSTVIWVVSVQAVFCFPQVIQEIRFYCLKYLNPKSQPLRQTILFQQPMQLCLTSAPKCGCVRSSFLEPPRFYYFKSCWDSFKLVFLKLSLYQIFFHTTHRGEPLVKQLSTLMKIWVMTFTVLSYL